MRREEGIECLADSDEIGKLKEEFVTFVMCRNKRIQKHHLSSSSSSPVASRKTPTHPDDESTYLSVDLVSAPEQHLCVVQHEDVEGQPRHCCCEERVG